MQIEVRRLSQENESDFFDFHTCVGGECFCTAWWVPTWEEWGTRTAADNRQLREQLLRDGQYDGYLLYADGKVAGWCQVGPRDRLAKLVGQFNLEPDPDAWAVTCFQIAPEFRGRGLAAELLARVLADLKARGVTRLQAYPKIDVSLPPGSQWTGPMGLYEAAGFRKVRDNKTRAIYEIKLKDKKTHIRKVSIP